MYVILITDQNSNIISDIESVGLVKEIIYGVLGVKVSEEGVFEKYVDLVFACDDMINLKMRNATSMSDIMTLLEMESSNEKMAMKITENQVRKA